MGCSTTDQIKDMMDMLFEVIDDLDERGIGNKLPFVNGDNALRELVKADMLLFIMRIADNDGDVITDECLEYINECLDYDFSQLTFEIARKKAIEVKTPNVCMAIPVFIIIDEFMEGNRLSSAYVQAVSLLMLGYIKCEGNVSLEKMVKYYRIIESCIKMIEKTLGKEVDYDPMEKFDDSFRDIIELAVKIDKKINEDDPIISVMEEAIRNTISGDTSDESTRDEKPDESDQESIKDGEIVDASKEDIGDMPGVIPINHSPHELTALEELDALVGLHEVKNQVNTIINAFRVRKRCEELNINRPEISMHMVFTGNAGTGKTTVARIIGKVFHEIGLLSKGHFTEVTRAELVGKYVGHTAPMVKSVFNKAKGGVLFIDEAYMLTNGDDDFGDEAVETLLKLMEDNRDDIIVIVAGYPKLMQEFLDANPGLRSRFPFVVEFPDYSGEELTRIFKSLCRENGIKAPAYVIKAVKSHFEHEKAAKSRNFGNARDVRNYFERMIINQSNRLVKDGRLDKGDLCRFTKEDIPRDMIIKPGKIVLSSLN